MRNESSIPTEATPRHGVLVLSGYGIRVAVERGHLTVSDGRGRERRRGRFSRADRSLRRLVVLGHTGTVSLDALRWLRDVGISFAQIDADGVVVAAFGPAGANNARLRRAQALAPSNGVGLAIARDLLRQKLAAQAGVLDAMGRAGAGPAAATVRRCRDALDGADAADVLRVVEAEAAGAYFDAWTGLPVRWAQRDAAKVPEHWRAFRSRTSPLSNAKRNAADPINAVLNYAYALLEASAAVACVAVGLDPGMGVLHADKHGRDSLALDVMEPARADVDRWLLDQLARRAFAARDFWETREGECRLMAPLAKQVAEAVTPMAAARVALVAERVARALSGEAGGRVALPPPSASGARGAGWHLQGRARGAATPAGALPPACRGCGLILDNPRRSWCPECYPEELARHAAEIETMGAAALAALRADGRDPAHGGRAAVKRRARNAGNDSAVAAWEREQGDGGSDAADPDAFARDVLPGLAGVSTRALMAATGLGPTYCKLIRRGVKTPHQRHWAALARLRAEQTP